MLGFKIGIQAISQLIQGEANPGPHHPQLRAGPLGPSCPPNCLSRGLAALGRPPAPRAGGRSSWGSHLPLGRPPVLRSRIAVTLGAHDVRRRERGQQRTTARRAIRHPRYNPQTIANDIMLLQVPPQPGGSQRRGRELRRPGSWGGGGRRAGAGGGAGVLSAAPSPAGRQNQAHAPGEAGAAASGAGQCETRGHVHGGGLGPVGPQQENEQTP